MTIKNLYPNQEPSLLLNFSKSIIVDPRLSFTRPSNSSYLKTNGTIGYSISGEPRLDFNYQSGNVGLLVEEQRTNFLNYSNDLTNTTWTSVRNQVTANAGTAPNGTNTANRIVPSIEYLTHFSSQVYSSFENGSSYTFSLFAKQQELKCLQIHFGTGPFPNRPYVNFDLSSGAIVSIEGGATASIEKMGNDWYRCSVTALSAVNTSSFVSVVAYPSGYLSRNQEFNTDGVSGLLVWGAQLEKGTHSTSFIETTSAQVTRASDEVSLVNSNFSSWFNQTEGCLVVEFDRQKLNYSQSNQNIILMDDGSSLNAIELYVSASNNICLKVKKNNFVTVDIMGDVLPLNKTTVAFSFKDNSYKLLMKGKSPKLAVIGELPVVNRMLLCADSNGITSSSTRIGSLRFYKYAASSLQLEYLIN